MMKKIKGLVTVALSARNARETIVRAVNSILGQTYESIELFVVDDASDDGMSAVLRENVKDPRLSVIVLDRNIGTYAAKNLVLKDFARGEFFAHQDADDFSHAARFMAQIAFLREHPDCAVCGTAIDEFYSDSAFRPKFSTETTAFLSPEDGYYHRHNIYPLSVTESDVLSLRAVIDLKLAMNGSLMFRTDLLEDIGGFDGHTFVGADTDMLMRMALIYAVSNLPDILYSRFFHGASLTGSVGTGFGSDLRSRYALQMEMWRERVRGLCRQKDRAVLKEAVLRECFFPASVRYSVFK